MFLRNKLALIMTTSGDGKQAHQYPPNEWIQKIVTRPSRATRASPEYLKASRRLGLRIRQLRESAGLTLAEVSGRVNMELSHWQRIEAGKSNATLATMVRMASALETELTEFFAFRPGDRDT
jgi:ribosome-binding protein aMBF1 (putative translation factor)